MAVRDVVQAAAGVGGDKLYVEDVFSTYLYDANLSSGVVVNNGINLLDEGGLIWTKCRNFTTNHGLYDSERTSFQKLLRSDTTIQEINSGTHIQATTTGYTIDSTGFPETNNNNTGAKHASWTFRKAPKFFDVVTGTTGSDTNYRISHNLGSVPGCIIFKRTDAASTWLIWHRGLSSTTNNFLKLGYNATDAQATRTNTWGTSGPTDTDFGIDTTYFGAGIPFVAYVFAHNDAGGFGDDGEQNVISCGSYTTNASYIGPNVNLGYEPAWILVKNASANGAWYIIDNMRGWTADGNVTLLNPNTNSAESTTTQFKLNATGFQDNGAFAGNATMIYIAIRRPMKTPESGTEVFYTDTLNASSSSATGFNVDMWIRGSRDGTGGTNSQLNMSRLSGAKYLATTQTAAEIGTNYPFGDGPSNQFTNITQGGSGVNWYFGRAPGFMDVVCYTGTGSNQNVTHGLGVEPELLIVKARNLSEGWMTTANGLGSGFIVLNGNDSFSSGITNRLNETNNTSTTFWVGTDGSVNSSGNKFIAYLFATVPGVSKVGTYTGTGVNPRTIDCGFSSGARFVLIKRIDSAGFDWNVWDSVRGITAGNDPFIRLNSTATEETGTNWVGPASTGFQVVNAAVNASGGTYLFLAIA